MQGYAICEISGKQYKVESNKPFEVSLQKEGDTVEADVLLISKDGKVEIGTPFLKEKLKLKRLEDGKGKKIRVSKFHAKANYRRTTGYRSKVTKVVWEAK